MQSFRTGNIATLTVQASIRCNDISIRTNNDNNTVRIASESVFSHLTRVSFFAAYERDRVCVVAVGKPNGNTCGFRAPETRRKRCGGPETERKCCGGSARRESFRARPNSVRVRPIGAPNPT